MTDEQSKRFILDTLHDWASSTEKALSDSASGRDLRKSGHLLSSFGSEVSGSADTTMQAGISFADSGRLVEIGWFRSRRLNKNATVGGSTLQRKNTRWFSKTAYRTIPPLIEALTDGYAEWAKNNITNELTK